MDWTLGFELHSAGECRYCIIAMRSNVQFFFFICSRKKRVHGLYLIGARYEFHLIA